MSGYTIDIKSTICELKEIQVDLRNVGEYRKANMIDFGLGYLNKFEAQQQEIERLKKSNESFEKEMHRLNDIANEITCGLGKENKKLKSQVSAMREAFEEYHLSWCGSEFCDEGCKITECSLRELGKLCCSNAGEAIATIEAVGGGEK